MGKLSMDLYLDNVRKKYKKARKKEKGEIIAEVCAISGFHKKHAIRVLNKDHRRMTIKKEARGRPTIYQEQVYLEPLKRIWLATDQLCGKRLKMALPLWFPHYHKAYGELDQSTYQGLLQMGSATIDRLLSKVKVQSKRGLSGTKPGKILKKHIPIKTDQWDEAIPGFLEADTVAHCGTSLMGDFVWSLTMTDICSGWGLGEIFTKNSVSILYELLPSLGNDSLNLVSQVMSQVCRKL